MVSASICVICGKTLLCECVGRASRCRRIHHSRGSRIGWRGGGFGGDARIRTGDKGFAGPCLTTWPRRQGSRFYGTRRWGSRILHRPVHRGLFFKKPGRGPGKGLQILERETGFEPATSTLARLHSTAELLPLSAPLGERQSNNRRRSCQPSCFSFIPAIIHFRARIRAIGEIIAITP